MVGPTECWLSLVLMPMVGACRAQGILARVQDNLVLPAPSPTMSPWAGCVALVKLLLARRPLQAAARQAGRCTPTVLSLPGMWLALELLPRKIGEGKVRARRGAWRALFLSLLPLEFFPSP